MTEMKKIAVEKVTLNIGVGKSSDKLEKGTKLIKKIVGITPVRTYTNKRIPTWGIRPGLAIGCKITLRDKKAMEIIPKLLQARENKLTERQFDNQGNISFGIPEYIDIPGVDYDPDIGVMGLQVCITLRRPGFRIKQRKVQPKKIPQRHRIVKDDSIGFMKDNYKVSVEAR